MKAESDPVIGL